MRQQTNALLTDRHPIRHPIRERLTLHLRLLSRPNPLHALIILRAINQPPLIIRPRIHEIRVIERELDSTVDNVIDRLDTEHERVVLVADLVAPAAEAAARVDVQVLQLGQELLEHAFALEGWRWIAVVEAAVVKRDDFVGWLEHSRVYEALDAVFHEGAVVDGLHRRLGDFEHDGPVWAVGFLVLGGLGAIGETHRGKQRCFCGLVVRAVVGEDGGAVEGAVVFGEVEPAFVADAFGARAADADANDVRAAEKEFGGEGDEVLVAHFLAERVDSHGVDHLVVFDFGAVGQEGDVRFSVNLLDSTMLAEALLVVWDSVGDGNPDASSAVSSWETEGRVWSPVPGSLVEDYVLDRLLDVWSGNSLTEPLALHLSSC